MYVVPAWSDSVAVFRLTPSVTQPPSSGLFTVVDVDVFPMNVLPPVNLPVIVVDVTESYVTARLGPVDVVPLFHLTATLAVPGSLYATISAEFSFAVPFATKVSSPLVIPGVPVQPDSVPLADSVWATLTVGDTGGVTVSVPANAVHVNAAAAAGVVVLDGAVVVDAAGSELFDEELLPHAGRNAVIAINAMAVTTRCLRTRVSSIPAERGRAPYIAAGLGLSWRLPGRTGNNADAERGGTL